MTNSLPVTARDILAYVQRDLTDPATGGFLSAEDADSQPRADSPERVEGAFYVWTQADIDRVLGPDDAPLFDWYYGVEKDGNVPAQSDARGELRGQNVLDATGRTPDEAAAKFKRPVEQVNASLARSREKLLAARASRPRPRRDDKIITSWNGLAISAFARAYAVLGDPSYLAAASKAAGFLQASLYDAKTGQLTRSYRQGASATAGFADDYAFLIRGLFDLYEADFQPGHLRWAETLQKTQDALFWDAKGGGYFNTAGTDPNLLLRSKTDDDGAEPSASSVAALNLARLGQALENEGYTKRGPPACCKLSTPRSSARRSRCRRCSWRSTSRSVRRARSSSSGTRDAPDTARDAQSGARTLPAGQHRPARRRRSQPGVPRLARGPLQGPPPAGRQSDRLRL